MNFPEFISVEVTAHCNLQCKMCPTGLGLIKKRGHMSLSLYRTIIDEAAGRAKHISHNLFGEPLLNPDLPEMIAYATSKGLTTGFSTNGTLLTIEKSRELIDAGLTNFIVSFDGITEGVYEYIRPGANFMKTVQNIGNFLEQRGRFYKPRLTLQFITMDANRHQRNQYKAFCKEIFNLLPKDIINIEKGYTTWLDSVPKYRTEDYPMHYTFCNYTQNSISVFWDGDVVLCCQDWNRKAKLGHVPKDSIYDIWNGDLLARIRKAFEDKHLGWEDKIHPICKKCYWSQGSGT